ncbi:MAG TPA: hypothetical protein VK106_01930 [Balneolaceae bacterium]|nr:hypothetical protein [Balneolaceae bacterium]
MENQGHIQSGEVVNLETLKGDMSVDSSYAIIKTEGMEVIRMALVEGKKTKEHQIEGELTVQCLKGSIIFSVDKKSCHLNEDDWLFVAKKQNFSYRVKQDTILLLTINFL